MRRRPGLRPLLFGAVLALGLLAGCPPGSKSREVAPGPCQKLYARCLIEGGKLGVCDLGPPERCEAPPCLVCVNQH